MRLTFVRVIVGILVLTIVLGIFVGVLISFFGTGPESSESQRAEPLPTASSVTCPTPREEAYLESVGSVIGILNGASQRLGSLFTQAENNASLFRDAKWQARVKDDLNVLLEASNRMKSLTPPTERARPLHDHLERAARAISVAVPLFTYGIDELVPEAIEEGTLYILGVGESIRDAESALSDMC